MAVGDSQSPQTPGKLPQLISVEAINAFETPIFFADTHGKMIYANEHALEYFGYESEIFLTLNVEDIDCGSYISTWQNHWEELRKKKKLSFETYHCLKSGIKKAVEARAVLVEGEGYELYCCFVIDIDGLRVSERVRFTSEEVFRKAMDETSDGVWDRNIQTGEVFYGDNWATVLGYSNEDLRSGKISWEKLLHPDDHEKTIKRLRDHISGKKTHYSAEFRIRNNQNKWQWIYARGKIIEYSEDGEPLRFVGTHTDITSMKEMEKSLIKTTEDTKLFAYSVAHDLKNPALSIHALVERFSKKLDDLTTAERRMYCDRIMTSTEQIVDLVGKINSYISSKETAKNYEQIPLKEVVAASRKEFAAQLQYRSVEWQEFSENPLVRMDRMSVIRVFRNLVENSLKYGGNQLTKICIRYQNTTNYHVISVEDDGVGMKPEEGENVFQPFERRESSLGKQGSGLGLAIVREIAASHKGEVWIKPNREKGVTFCFAIFKYL